MQDLTSHYPIQSETAIQRYLESYLPLVMYVADQLGLNLNTSLIRGDHLGLQVMSSREFDTCHDLLSKIADMIHDGVIHERRNRVYRFKNTPKVKGITIPKIETFEPKPEVDPLKLRCGIEHIAFIVDDYDSFLRGCKQRGLPIEKVVDDDPSKFFKTKLLNGIEIEFRNDSLGE